MAKQSREGSGEGRIMRRMAAAVGLVAVMALPTGAPVAADPAAARCGPAQVPPADPFDVYAHRAGHVPALDLCDGSVEAVWQDDGDRRRLAALRLTLRVAGDLAERPPSTWFEFSGHYDRPDGDVCSLALNYYDRPPSWDPFNAEAMVQCQDPADDSLLPARSVWEYDDVDPALVSLEGSVLEVVVPFDDFTPWARSVGDELAAAGTLADLQITSGVHSHLPYRNPLPIVMDSISGGSVPLD